MPSPTLLVALAALASLASAAPLACGARQYLDAASSTCKQCPISMMSCTSPTTAVTCARGRYLTVDKQCVLASGCPQHTFADSSKQACTKCYVDDAATCVDASTSGTISCMTGCFTGHGCVPAMRLPGGFYCPNHVQTPCPGSGVVKCDAAGKATACKTGFNLNSQLGTCMKCVGAQTYNVQTGSCELVCRNLGVMAGRDFGLQFVNAQYPSDDGTACLDCTVPFAYSCGAGGVATACQTSLDHLWHGTCVHCNEVETFDSTTGTCHLMCPGGSFMTASDGTVTIVRATYLDTNIDVCVLCNDEGAAACDNTGVSTSCLDGYDLSGDACLVHRQAMRKFTLGQ